MADAPWDIHYYLLADKTSVPGEAYLDACPGKVGARIEAVLDSVAESPPPKFSGGGMWEAMSGAMKGIYEIRQRHAGFNYRLFCILDKDGPGLPGPAVIVLTGMTKPVRTGFSDRDYARVRKMRDDYLKTSPRRVAK